MSKSGRYLKPIHREWHFEVLSVGFFKLHLVMANWQFSLAEAGFIFV
jgi:hypothetical protein